MDGNYLYLRLKFSTKIFPIQAFFLKGTSYWIVLYTCVHNENHGTEFFAGQEILCVLWNPEVQYCVHKSLPLVHILSQMNPAYSFPSCFLNYCCVGNKDMVGFHDYCERLDNKLTFWGITNINSCSLPSLPYLLKIMSDISSAIFDILLWSLKFCINACNKAPLTVTRSLCNIPKYCLYTVICFHV